MSATLKIAIGSLILGMFVLCLKAVAWWITGSVALLSDALESTVNLATAMAALVAIKVAARPPDKNHPFGHHKAEFFSAVFEGVMIIVAALLILREAYYAFQNPRTLDAPIEGLLINLTATALNGLWSWLLVRKGRQLRSPALIADGKHLWTDVVTSIGVALGILLAFTTGWWILDPVMATFVAINILWSGSKVVKESLSGLMDESVADHMVNRIRQIIAVEARGAVEAHDLKTRNAGSVIFIEFHMVVPGDMTVYDAHEICDVVEAAIQQAIPESLVTIHVEPEHKSNQHGAISLSKSQEGN